MDPQTYSRMFLGIGVCERAETSDAHPVLLICGGTAGTPITAPPVRLVVGQEGYTFELQCPGLGNFVAVRLRDADAEDRTRVTVTYFGAGRIHPVIAEYGNAAVVDRTHGERLSAAGGGSAVASAAGQ
ncbi:hypothetical protein [Nocardia sp. CA-119907]|uniref:hypothetical protein n=1 Tax=Nocardia sp. CA-119907 TaxID=3239973 RepID=UPI003D966D0F